MEGNLIFFFFGVMLFVLRAKTFGFVKVKVMKVKMLLYNLIKEKQYDKY